MLTKLFHRPLNLRFIASTDGEGGEPEPVTQEIEIVGGREPETFDKAYVEKLRAEAAKYRTEAKANGEAAKVNAEAAKRLAELEDAGKTETQRLTDQLAKANAELAALVAERDAAKAAELRAAIALEHGLSPEDAELLVGDEKAQRALAARLTQSVKLPPGAPVNLGVGNRAKQKPVGTPETLSSIISAGFSG
ncbi:MAG: hypothetical protein LBB58_02415 [Cellulomonadaceae bacterium]|jgi:hypothetical protein|nr:hypothetical protein [Cellulomonadaceae bacterium]